MTAEPQLADTPRLTEEIVELVAELAGDWDYEGHVGPQTRFLADLGMESLDLVVLGTSLQSRYGTLPFAEFLAAMGNKPVVDRDVTIAELADFVVLHCGPASATGGRP